MGLKGDKHTDQAEDAAQLLVSKLDVLGAITSRKRCGGQGILHDGKMFGLIDSSGTIFLKVNDEIKGDFIDKGAEQHSRMPYFSVPDAVLQNDDELLKWAQGSIAISQ